METGEGAGTGFLKDRTRQGIRQRLASVINSATLRQPPLLPPGFRNPMTRALVGNCRRPARGLSAPPVSVEDLVRLVAVLDAYALGVLAPLMLFAPRPSEIGRILAADYDMTTATLSVICRPAIGYLTKGRRDKILPVNAALAACIGPFVERAGGGPLFMKRAIYEGRARSLLVETDEGALAREYDEGRTRLAAQLKRPPTKDELERLSDRVWRAAGALDDKAVRRELRRAAAAAGLAKTPTPNGIRHLFESLTEEARLAPGVTRFLMGHGPGRGDSLFHYNHTRPEVLRQQVAMLDELRRPLLDALRSRACDLGHGRPRATDA